MPRSRTEPQGPDWSPQQTLRALKQKLAQLRELRKRYHQEVAQEYDLWQDTTWAVFEHGFGKRAEISPI
jgi:hypothetical protein